MEISSGLIGDFPYSIWKHDFTGHLCGYLGIPQGHLWFEKSYDDIDADVHGGLTYARMGHDNYPTPIEAGLDIWWVGFDCGHAGDYIPLLGDDDGHEWTQDEVFEELVKLAEQAYAAAQEQMHPENVR